MLNFLARRPKTLPRRSFLVAAAKAAGLEGGGPTRDSRFDGGYDKSSGAVLVTGVEGADIDPADTDLPVRNPSPVRRLLNFLVDGGLLFGSAVPRRWTADVDWDNGDGVTARCLWLGAVMLECRERVCEEFCPY